MIYKLDVPDWRLDPPEEKSYHDENVVELSQYESWKCDMELAGKWVPNEGETIYIPYDDAVDCFSEEWEGNITQQEYVEQGLIFATANEAVAKARQDMEAVLYGKSTPEA